MERQKILKMINDEDWKMVQKVQKVISEWKNIHTDLNEAMKYFEDKNPEAYKVIIEISKVENNLIEKANEEFSPLMTKLKKILSKK